MQRDKGNPAGSGSEDGSTFQILQYLQIPIRVFNPLNSRRVVIRYVLSRSIQFFYPSIV